MKIKSVGWVYLTRPVRSLPVFFHHLILSLSGFFVGRMSLGMRSIHRLVLGKNAGAIRKRYSEYLYELYGESNVHFKLPSPNYNEQ